MKKGVIGAVIALVILAGLAAAFVIGKDSDKKNEPTNQPTTTETTVVEENNSQPEQPAENVVADTDEVEIENMAFVPANITVKKGTKVTWTNKDDVGHTVTSDNDSQVVFDSPLLTKGQSFSFTFNEVGTFNYHCQPHPQMTGSVTVTE